MLFILRFNYKPPAKLTKQSEKSKDLFSDEDESLWVAELEIDPEEVEKCGNCYGVNIINMPKASNFKFQVQSNKGLV